ncbi:FAD-binding oxidoreductase [Cupriavidus sp. 8B]
MIIGGGIAGCCTALSLSREGVRVTLLEKGLIGCEQSSRNWGWCRQQGRDPKELELAKLSLDMWPGLAMILDRDPGFQRSGVTFLTDKEAEVAAWQDWQKLAAEKGIDSVLLSAEQARSAVLGGTSGKWIAGLSTPSDGRAEPSRTAPFVAQAAQRLGAKILEGCAVHTVETTNGRVSAVHTERGTIRCQSVVVAAGAWTSLFLRKLGVRFPQAYVHGSVCSTLPIDANVEGCISTPYFSFRARQDGGLTVAKSGRGTVYVTPSLLRYAYQFLPTYLLRRKKVKLRLTAQFWRELRQEYNYLKRNVSPFHDERILDPSPDSGLVGEAVRDVESMFPGLGKLTLGSAWGGVIDSTPDAVPVISEIRALPGLVVASGFSGHGFGLGPGVGHVVACLVQGRSAPIDMTPFRYDRMIDGSRLVPYIHF